jgi:hypothetical protein
MRRDNAATRAASARQDPAPTPSSDAPTMLNSFLSMYGIGASAAWEGIQYRCRQWCGRGFGSTVILLYYQPMTIENPRTPYEALTAAYTAELNVYALTSTQINDVLYIRWLLVLEILKVARGQQDSGASMAAALVSV